MDINSVGAVFIAQGYSLTRNTAKLDEYQAPTTGQFLYLDKEGDLTSSMQILIHPDLKYESYMGLSGVTCPKPDRFRHHSNMRRFPKHKHRGETEIPYARALEITSL